MGSEETYSIEVDPERRLVLTTWGVSCSDEALAEYQKTVWARPEVREFNELIDFRCVSETSVTSRGVRDIARLSARMHLPESARTALVVDDALSFGMGRMYEGYRGNDDESTRDIRVFKELDAALEWLTQAHSRASD